MLDDQNQENKDLETEIKDLSKDLERANHLRITLHQDINSEEKILRDLNIEKDRLIGQKSVKLNIYADKERILDNKEFENAELKKIIA